MPPVDAPRADRVGKRQNPAVEEPAVKDRLAHELAEKVGLQYRNRIRLALQHEDEGAYDKALDAWDEIIREIREQGGDPAPLAVQRERVRKNPVRGADFASRKEPEAASAREAGFRESARIDLHQEQAFQEMKNRFRAELQSLCLSEGINLETRTDENRLQVKSLLDRILREHLREIPEWVRRKDLLDEIVDDVIGLGILEGYLRNPSVTEVMVNGTEVFYEQDGQIFPSARSFNSLEEVRRIIDRIIQPVNRRIDESSPLVDARLPDGSRVNIVIPPVAVDGPTISIRKFSPLVLTEVSLIEKGSLTSTMVEFFHLAVVSRQNIMIAGRASSGKTTLLNILGSFIPPEERIITIEDMAELKLPQRHVVRLEARQPNIQGKGEIPIRTLFRNALHMRPDRIIVGECRGAETLDMLQAMNTGHDGSISTVHANSPLDMFARLEVMVGMSERSIPPQTVRKQIASGLNLVIYCVRFPEGQRKVTEVCEILPGRDESQEIRIEHIYRFERTGLDEAGRIQGRFVTTGYVPSFVRERTELSQDPAVQALFRPGESPAG
jgi:pilus assembly protein CpaF